MNVISYSLWGDRPMYKVGIRKNLELITKFYPGWHVFIYTDEENKRELEGAVPKFVHFKDPPCNNGMFWRFWVAADPSVKRWMVRDADSRVSSREVSAVQEWIDSGLPFHSMRDHPHHYYPIMGSGFGGLTSAWPEAAEMLKTGGAYGGDREKVYDTDQVWLAHTLWPIMVERGVLQHDLCYHELWKARPWPASFNDFRFVGEVFDENDQPRSFDWEMRFNYLRA